MSLPAFAHIIIGMATSGAQPGQIETLRPARTIRRVEASLTNILPMAILMMMFSCLISSIFPIEDFAKVWGWSPFGEALCSIAINAMPLVVLIIDGAMHRATYGMRSRRLVLRKAGGKDPGFGLSFLRIFVGILMLPLLPVSAVLQWKQGRTLADIICGTEVCERIVPDSAGKGNVRPAFPVADTPPPASNVTKGREA